MHNLNQVLSSARYSTYTSCCILMFLVNFYEVKYSTTGWRESASTATHAYLKSISQKFKMREAVPSHALISLYHEMQFENITWEKRERERESVRGERNDKQTDIAWDCHQHTYLDERKNRMKTHRRSASKLDNITNMLKLGSSY